MKSSYVKICLCTLWFTPSLVLGQKTEVSVLHGTVRAETSTATADINAGRKATMLSDEKPIVTVADPLVDDVMKLYEWVQEEKLAQRQRIDTFNIMVQRVDNDITTVIAVLAEWQNYKSIASRTFALNMGLQDDIKMYDLEGNLLPVEMKKTDDNSARYTVTHTKTVAPGENYRFISVSRKPQHVDIDAQGMRHQHQSWNTPYCLNFYRLILPPSAVFVASSRPVIATENFNGRIVITCRAYTGPLADGKFHFAYLWPEKDRTTLTDLPGQFRGLRDPQKEAVDQEYQSKLISIFSGQAHRDQSTPLLALLSLHSAVTLKDEKQLIDLIGNPGFKEAVIEYTDDAMDQISQGIGGYGFLSTPAYPEDPQNGSKHPIHLCRKGSLLHEATVEMVFQNGKWYFWNYEMVWTSSRAEDKQKDTDQDKVVPKPETLAALQAKGFLMDWEVAGPYTQMDKKAVDLLDIPFGPELTDADIDWRPMSVEVTEINGQKTAHLNLKQTFSGDPRQVAYLRTTIPSDRNQILRLDIRSDDAVKAWLNGRLIHTNNTMRGIDVGPDAITVELKKGVNPLRLKVTQDLWGWGTVVQLGSDKAVCPHPAGGIIHPKTQVQLGWSPAVTARAHRVHFGTDRENLTVLAEVSEAQALPALPLEAGVRYYWRVDEILASGSSVTGDIWTFVALTVDPTQATLYMHDGTQMTSATHRHRHGEAAFDGPTNIGHDPRWSTLKGAIDDVHIYNYALDKAEIEAVHHKINK